MTKALLKKQMLEVFSWLYQDKKSGKNRTGKGIAGYVLVWLIVFGFLGGVFGVAATALCKPLLSVDMGWLYWCLMSMIAIFFGVFGSVFNTYSSLYQAKDNDLLLSMPIPTSRILLVRLSGVYAMGLMYELIAVIPTIIVWFLTAPFSIVGTANVLLIPIVLSFLILVLSAVLGWVVAVVVTKVKHRNLITVFLSLVFMAAYYYLYAQAYSALQTILLNAQTWGNKLKIALYPLYHMGKAAEGNMLSMALFTAIIAVLVVITYIVLSRSFLKLATANRGAAKTVYKERAAKTGSVGSALLFKEFRRFLGSANYMLNCGLGIILMPVSAVMLIWKANTVRAFLAADYIQNYVPLIVVGGICMLTTMNDMTAPSVSLEGKNLWIAQSFPVSGRQVLAAKLWLQLILTWIPAIPLLVAAEWILKLELIYAVLIPVITVLFVLLMALLGLVLNLKMPNLHWSSEMIPIKQSAPVMFVLFGGWVILVALAGAYALLKNDVSVAGFLVSVCALLLFAGSLLLWWLMTKGAKIFERLT